MTPHSIGFIGAGRVTRILLGGFQAAGVRLPPTLVSDTQAESLHRLTRAFPAITPAGADNSRPAGQDLVVLALHPPALATALADVRAALQPESVVVSLAPKITLARLSELLGGFDRVARLIPNAPSIIGAGYNPIAFGDGLDANERADLVRWFQPLGVCPEVAEAKLEGFALLTGMGPTYLWFQLQTLRELARDFGLSDADISPALKRMVCGAARTLLESGLPPEEVMDLIPVKPLAEQEAGIRQIYRDRLSQLYAKIKP